MKTLAKAVLITIGVVLAAPLIGTTLLLIVLWIVVQVALDA